MSGATWFIGDLHFGHEKVAGLRGFESVAEHDLSIMRRWEKQVQDGDLVHILGDLSSGGRAGELHALQLLYILPGRKRLVAGNHDSVASIHRTLSPHVDRFNSVFERVGDFARVKINQQEVMLSHYPYEGDHTREARFAQYRLRDAGLPLVHAHTHSATRAAGRELCVSWEAWGRLVNQGDVANWLTGLPATPDLPTTRSEL